MFQKWSPCSRWLAFGMAERDDIEHHYVLLSLIDLASSSADDQPQCPLQLVLLPYGPEDVDLSENGAREGPWELHWASDSSSLTVTGAWTRYHSDGVGTSLDYLYQCNIDFVM